MPCTLLVRRSLGEAETKVDAFPLPLPTKLAELEKIRVGIVNYLNTRPLIYGLQRPPINDKIILTGDYPSRIATQLLQDEIDVGLVPVAALKNLPEYHIVGDYCIGTEGEIASVALFSEVPVQEIQKVYLDYQSRSSVELLKFLMREYWGISPGLLPAENESYREKIRDTTAGLVIGDRALEQRKRSTFIYDLGSEWRAITGLPFVFAVWASKKKLPDEFTSEFSKANAMGLEKINEIVTASGYDLYDLKKYYNLHLSYHLDDAKKRGMAHFLELIT